MRKCVCVRACNPQLHIQSTLHTISQILYPTSYIPSARARLTEQKCHATTSRPQKSPSRRCAQHSLMRSLKSWNSKPQRRLSRKGWRRRRWRWGLIGGKRCKWGLAVRSALARLLSNMARWRVGIAWGFQPLVDQLRCSCSVLSCRFFRGWP